MKNQIFDPRTVTGRLERYIRRNYSTGDTFIARDVARGADLSACRVCAHLPKLPFVKRTGERACVNEAAGYALVYTVDYGEDS